MAKPLIPANRGRERRGSMAYETFQERMVTAREVSALMDRFPERYTLYPKQLAFLLWLGESDDVEPGGLPPDGLLSGDNAGVSLP